MNHILSSLLLSLTLLSCSSHKGMMCGAYTDHRNLSAEDKTLFEQTYKGTPVLTPQKVATQVVAGTNYSFICRDSKGKKYEVIIFEPLPCNGGHPEVTSVQAVK